MSISAEQNAAASSEFAELAEKQFGGSGVTVSVEHHSNGKYAFVRLTCPPQHWIALAKWMRFDGGVNYCSMITGTHYPDGGERGWGVAYHFCDNLFEMLNHLQQMFSVLAISLVPQFL